MFEDFKEKVRKHLEKEFEKRLFSRVFASGNGNTASIAKEKERIFVGEENNN